MRWWRPWPSTSLGSSVSAWVALRWFSPLLRESSQDDRLPVEADQPQGAGAQKHTYSRAELANYGEGLRLKDHELGTIIGRMRQLARLSVGTPELKQPATPSLTPRLSCWLNCCRDCGIWISVRNQRTQRRTRSETPDSFWSQQNSRNWLRWPWVREYLHSWHKSAGRGNLLARTASPWYRFIGSLYWVVHIDNNQLTTTAYISLARSMPYTWLFSSSST